MDKNYKANNVLSLLSSLDSCRVLLFTDGASGRFSPSTARAAKKRSNSEIQMWSYIIPLQY